MMTLSGQYMPAPNFLATGYPLDRGRCEKLWNISNDPATCTKEDICDMIFVNNEAMLQPVLAHAQTEPANHPFPILGDVDMEGSPYASRTFADMRQLNLQMNPAAHDPADDDAPQDFGFDDD